MLEERKNFKIYHETIPLSIAEEKDMGETVKDGNMLYNLHLIKTGMMRSGKKEVQEYFKDQISCGEKIQLKKRISGEGKEYSCFYGTVVDIYPNFFRIQYEKNGWYECFLYTDLFIKEILIEKIEENCKVYSI